MMVRVRGKIDDINHTFVGEFEWNRSRGMNPVGTWQTNEARTRDRLHITKVNEDYGGILLLHRLNPSSGHEEEGTTKKNELQY